jgi:hypothetical protein
MVEGKVRETGSRFRGLTMPIRTPFRNIVSLVDQLSALSDDMRDLDLRGRPSNADLRHAPTLSTWTFGELLVPCLVGEVVGHPLLGNRPRIHTSQLIAIDTDGGWARTWSRFYRLEMPADIARSN